MSGVPRAALDSDVGKTRDLSIASPTLGYRTTLFQRCIVKWRRKTREDSGNSKYLIVCLAPTHPGFPDNNQTWTLKKTDVKILEVFEMWTWWQTEKKL